jgi:hypothetical protein
MIHCGEPSASLANDSQSQVLFHKFVINNVGGKSLTVQDIKSNCTCTGISPVTLPAVLKSGEELPIVVSLDTTGKKGKLSTMVLVFSDDPRTPVLQLSMARSALPQQ